MDVPKKCRMCAPPRIRCSIGRIRAVAGVHNFDLHAVAVFAQIVAVQASIVSVGEARRTALHFKASPEVKSDSESQTHAQRPRNTQIRKENLALHNKLLSLQGTTLYTPATTSCACGPGE